MKYTKEFTQVSTEIKAAQKRRSPYKKVKRSVVVCPYNVGIANQNEPELQGIVLCAFYQEQRQNCNNGLAKYLGKDEGIMMVRFPMPRIEVFECSDTMERLRINTADYCRPLIEEVKRKEIIKNYREGDKSVEPDVKLAKRLPLEIPLREMSNKFKELLYRLMKKNAIDWYNTLDVRDLKSILSLQLIGEDTK